MGYSCVGLYMPKNLMNVGGVVRAAACYDASLIVINGKKYKDVPTDTGKYYKDIPIIHTVGDMFDNIPYGCVPIAVEFIKESRPLNTFVHPKSSFYIFGPEDGSIPKDILGRCKYTVYVPTKHCMNLAATVNVVLYDRMVKETSRTSYFSDVKLEK